MGVRISDVSQALNTLVAGQEATTFNEGTDQYEVRVRAINNFRSDVEGLKRLIVPSSKVGWVTLDRLIKVKEGTGPSSMTAQSQPQVTLLLILNPGSAQTSRNIDELLTLICRRFTERLCRTRRDGQSGILSPGDYLSLFMYIVLAAQFESFIHPSRFAHPSLSIRRLLSLWAGANCQYLFRLGLLLFSAWQKTRSAVATRSASDSRMIRYYSILRSTATVCDRF